ncbi:VOC family protein [Sphingomonas sp. MMS24-J13]|uniref:VOC family protein n=1 Tax=Sphingomonas sp. MMS24-J13 TaxID=3238686 RepID=UPI00384DAE7F
MASARLDHVNIQTVKLAETVRFYSDVLDLDAGDPPPPLDPRLVQWMFGAGGDAIFHLTSPGSMAGIGDIHIGEDTGAVHHVALDCQDHDAMVAKLERLGLAHRRNHVKAIDLKQIFVHDPNGVLLELNYRSGHH